MPHLKTPTKRAAGIKYFSDSESDQITALVQDTEKLDHSTPKASQEQASPILRTSERLQRRSQKQFRMPQRRNIFEQIQTTSSPCKSVADIKPKRVNDFMKVTNRYNHDCGGETSDESSLDDFIVNDDDEVNQISSSSSTSAGSQQASDDDSSGNESTQEVEYSSHKTLNEEQLARPSVQTNIHEQMSEDDEEKLNVLKRKRNKSQCIESDGSLADIDDDEVVVKKVKYRKNRSNALEGSEDEVDEEEEYLSINLEDYTAASEDQSSISSRSTISSDSDSEGGTRLRNRPSRRRRKMMRKNKKKLGKFEKLRELRETKRKLDNAIPVAELNPEVIVPD